MHKPESTLKNEMYKILWDVAIQTNRLISARRSDLVINNNNNNNKQKKESKKEHMLYSWFSVLVDRRVKIKENEKRDINTKTWRENEEINGTWE